MASMRWDDASLTTTIVAPAAALVTEIMPPTRMRQGKPAIFCGFDKQIYAAMAKFCFAAMPPKAMCGRS
jgi:hypothetical protein